MEGAREYCKYFRTEQVGRLYFVASDHARGKTFRIFVLPEGEAAIPNGKDNPPENPDAVEVYGVVSGQPGWTESYGWLYRGPWIADFQALLFKRREEVGERERHATAALAARTVEGERRIAALLDTYPRPTT